MVRPVALIRFGVSVALVLLVLRVLRRFLFRGKARLRERDVLRRSDVTREPDELFVVVNGLLGSSTSGAHVVDALVAHAAARGRSVVAVRVQASATLAEQNIYHTGLVGAADVVVERIAELRLRFPSLKRLSFVGNSFGALVLRLVARTVWRQQPAWQLGVFVSFPSPHVGLSPQTFASLAWWRRLAVAWLPWQCFSDLRLLDRAGAMRQPLLLDLGTDVDHLKAFESRAAVCSPHDTTVPFDEACFWSWPASAPIDAPPFDSRQESRLLAVEPSTDTQEPPLTYPPTVRSMAAGLRSMPWTLIAVTGEHSDSTKSWTSVSVVNHVITNHCGL